MWSEVGYGADWWELNLRGSGKAGGLSREVLLGIWANSGVGNSE